MRAARRALEPLLHATGLDFRIAWVHIGMMPADNLDSATVGAVRITHPRVAVFHDPTHMLGRAMARRLHWKNHVAWDTYFIYKRGILWPDDGLPAPDAWFHQLKSTGDDLRVALEASLRDAASQPLPEHYLTST